MVLRNVGKKAQVTKIRALEELGSVWVERALVGGGGGENVDVAMSLVEMIPAWVCLPFFFFCCFDGGGFYDCMLRFIISHPCLFTLLDVFGYSRSPPI